ncbi:germin-like protein subfamily 1 member 18 [Carica papaya]|uniref:germin-like protein subfamily 1 member 18 n=1 Tax=Carica papaya TaxID=3649 RepID=UPI000B8D035C|nr:germin-like protein subfamily 1 member 18 [Carica papaya]
MKTFQFLVIVVFLALASFIAYAYDPSPLQDYCVATNDTELGVFVNGNFCKDPKDVTSDDFFYPELLNPLDIDNQLGFNAIFVFVDKFPGLNTLGISLAYAEFAPRGVAPPHIHPRGSEIIIVLEGTIFIGFVVSDQNNNTFFYKVLGRGDVFLIPIAQVHFAYNIGNTTATALVAYNSQNPGVTVISNAIFGSNPPINPYILAKAFQLNIDVIEYLQSGF